MMGLFFHRNQERWTAVANMRSNELAAEAGKNGPEEVDSESDGELDEPKLCEIAGSRRTCTRKNLQLIGVLSPTSTSEPTSALLKRASQTAPLYSRSVTATLLTSSQSSPRTPSCFTAIQAYLVSRLGRDANQA